MERKELLFEVNPVFATAKGCLGLLMSTGVKGAKELGSKIDLTVQGANNTPPEIIRAYTVSNEARFHIGNIMAKESGCDTIVDLPCGYVPRGLVISEEGKQFYGLDLPAVIEELEPAIREIATSEQNEKMHFTSVDATNLDSLRNALKGVDGKICILTDGLLGYFNNPELDSVLNNIRELLKEHGGVWITADKFGTDLGAITYAALTDSDGEIVRQAMRKGGSKVADIPINHTVIHGTVSEAKKYFEEHGFNIKEVSYAEKLPKLSSLDDNEKDLDRLRKAYEDIIMWVMTVNEGKSAKGDNGKKFNFRFDREGDILHCRLTGRLDTINGPKLLSGFREQQLDGVLKIEMDLTDTEYISSAGLRVFMIMSDSISDENGFYFHNPNEDVKEILEVTGFINMFDIR